MLIERLSVCIETLFPPSMSYDERIRKIASLGFRAYEFWYFDMEQQDKGWIKKGNAKNIDVIQKLNEEYGLGLVCFAINSPDGKHGGHILDRKGLKNFLKTLDHFLPIALKINIPYLIAFPGFENPGIAKAHQIRMAVSALQKIDAIINATGIKLLIEPLSIPKYTGYIVPTVQDATALIREAGVKNMSILFDFFHIQSMTGNLINTISNIIDLIGHTHISGVPGQHEPINGEVNYPFIIKKMLEMGYKGYFGLEYRPLINPIDSLKETQIYLNAF